MDREQYLKLLALTTEQRIEIFNSGIFNDILEAYIRQFLKEENIKVDNIHDKLKDILDLQGVKDVLKANNTKD